MTIHATFNPIGSSNPKDLIDNAQNLDYQILGPLLSYPDRLGVNRLSWAGIEASFAAAQAQRNAEHNADQSRRESEFDADQARRESEFDTAQLDRSDRFDLFIASSGYDVIGDYASQPVTFTERNQLMLKDGELWKPKASIALPYATTGVWASESSGFVSVGDAALRQEMAAPGGSSLSGYVQKGAGAVPRNADKKLDEQPITIEDFLPNIVYVEAPYGQAQVDAATPVDDALDAAIAAGKAAGRKVQLFSKVYRLDRTSDFISELNIEGVACGQWIPNANSGIAGGAYNPDMSGSILLITGAAPKVHTALGITDCRTGGGVVANDNIHDPGFDDQYSLTSFYNDDANPTTGAAATPKLFSVGVKLGRGVQGVKAKNFRIMPSFKGIEGYLSGEIGYGDAVDVGLYIDNASQNTFENVQVVGYWQIAGRLMRAGVVGSEPGGIAASIEHNVFDSSVFTGMVGTEIRGADSHRIKAVTASTVEILFAANHPFDPTLLGGAFRTTTNLGFNFTGLAMNGANLQLTGVTPSPAGLPLTAGIVPATMSNGMALCEDRNCVSSGMSHLSGNRVTAAEMGAFRKNRPSTAFMMSGNTLRGYSAPGTKLALLDDVAIHLHWCNDVIFGPKFEIESSNANGLGVGCRIISSPSEGLNTRVANPSGSVFRLDIDTLRNTNDVDYRPVNAAAPPRFPLGNGYLLANLLHVKAVHDNIDNGRFIRPGVGGSAGIKDSVGVVAAYFDDAAGQVRINKQLRLDQNLIFNSNNGQKIDITGGGIGFRGSPHVFSTGDGVSTMMRMTTTEWRSGTDNTTDVGTSSFRMRTIYAGTGAINTSDGRMKTAVRPFTEAELLVSQALLGEVGMYQFLDAVAIKGEGARWHVGMTVQRCIEIFEAHGLDPFRNAFVCYDQWDDIYEEWEAEHQTLPAIIDPETGAELEPETQVMTKEAGRKMVREAGDIYSFRTDQLALAMLAGVHATQRDLEQRLAALESK